LGHIFVSLPAFGSSCRNLLDSSPNVTIIIQELNFYDASAFASDHGKKIESLIFLLINWNPFMKVQAIKRVRYSRYFIERELIEKGLPYLLSTSGTAVQASAKRT